MDEVEKVGDDFDLFVDDPLPFSEFVEEGTEEAGYGVGGTVTELFEESVEVERLRGFWIRCWWGWGGFDGGVGIQGCGEATV